MQTKFKVAFLAILVTTLLGSCAKHNFKEPGFKTIHDSISNTDWLVDTVNKTVSLFPTGEDDQPMVQSASQFQQRNPGYLIICPATGYQLNEPVIVDSIANGVYQQSFINISGVTGAKDVNAAYSTNFHCAGSCFMLQQCKGCSISNIAMTGPYTKSSGFTQVQIDTTARAQWEDGINSDNYVSPVAGIVIDPFSDPSHYTGVYQEYPGLSQYYLPGMSTSGSTDVVINECDIRQFCVGILITAGWQQNGDIIDVNNTQIGNCISAIAATQSQSKDCEVNNLMVWGGVETIFDGRNYGAGKGDGATMPIINGTSIAGSNKQIFNCYALSFPISASNIVAESILKIGIAGGPAGCSFSNFDIDFQTGGVNTPSPDFYYWGPNTTWTGCMLRVYNGQTSSNRIVMNSQANTFIGGSFSTPPLCTSTEAVQGEYGQEIQTPTFQNVSLFYLDKILNTNQYDSISPLGGNAPVFINPSTFTGYFVITYPGDQPLIGDLIVSFAGIVEDGLPAITTFEYPVGYVTAVCHDTVYLKNTGQGIYTGSLYRVYDTQVKVHY